MSQPYNLVYLQTLSVQENSVISPAITNAVTKVNNWTLEPWIVIRLLTVKSCSWFSLGILLN